jgi:hypothetical protein
MPTTTNDGNDEKQQEGTTYLTRLEPFKLA